MNKHFFGSRVVASLFTRVGDFLMVLAATAVVLAFPPPAAAHEQLIDMGTFGGPASGVSEPGFGADPTRTLNAREMVGMSATSIPTTATSNPFACGGGGDCCGWHTGRLRPYRERLWPCRAADPMRRE